ncbi:FAD-binding oxidoreductase [Terracoccus sp. 273MFTsu3.1]|uniref:FAD-binding oxidoreductase n=1 Tax=Terracoccus sp. 273MFTsu3.1 TaxID=1172188 RepID=UPI00036FEE2A|nr:FAD-binding oxidoreductase [Terracoccus sp. 273MFTsu3.1]
MARVSLASGVEFDSEPDVPILLSGEKHGARLEYSCRTGRCISCKALVLSGVTTALQHESGLSAEEQGAGWILTCVRSADSDVVFAEDNEIEFDLPRAVIVPLRVTALERVTEDILVVRLRLAPSACWDYVPGQHVEIIGPNGIRRAYSLAGAPGRHSALELHVKRYPGGELSEYWFGEAAVGDLLRLRGPLGTFVLRESDRPLVFLATGTGIAPVKAMLEHLEQVGPQRPVTVYLGVRTAAELHWKPPAWPAHWDFVPVLSRCDRSWSGRTGYVQEALLADCPNLAAIDVYACGSDAMIRDARRLLVAAGLDPRRFFSDAFVESAPRVADE